MIHLRETFRVLQALVLACLAVAGCRSAPEQALESPAVRGEIIHFPGSPLSGPVIMDLESMKPEDGVLLSLTLVALERLPEDALEPVGPRTRLITSFREGNPVAHVARLAAGARVGFLEDAGDFLSRIEAGEWGPWCRVDTFASPIFEGTTTVFRTVERTGGPHAVEIQAYWKPGGRPELVLALEDIVVQENGREMAYREVLLMDAHSEAEQKALALLFRSPFRSSPARALAAVLEVVPAPKQDPRFSQCLGELKIASARARLQPAMASVDRTELPGIQSVLDQFTSPFSKPLERRRALVYLAGHAKAPLAEDVVLSAPDDVVDRFGSLVLDVTAQESIESKEALAWILEHAAYRLLIQFKTEKDSGPVLEGVLAHYTGEVGRHAAILEEVVRAAKDWNDLQDRLVTENLIYLEDISPASRSRAFDWLAARDLAPQGYDPLAPIEARRAALNRAAERGNS